MAKTTRSDTAYSIYVRSAPGMGAMTVWALLDFARALQAAGIPDNATITDHHDDVRNLTALSVRHTVVVERAEVHQPEAADG